MEFIGYLVLIFVGLLAFGRFQRGSPSHPANAYRPTVTGTAGDAFGGATPTIAAGVTESNPAHGEIDLAPHVVLPIDSTPTPLAIQRPHGGVRFLGGPTRKVGGGGGCQGYYANALGWTSQGPICPPEGCKCVPGGGGGGSGSYGRKVWY